LDLWATLKKDDLLDIIQLSLGVSLSATALATLLGLPLGGILAVYDFRGRRALTILLNGLLGLPPVVVGLVLYLLLSHSGPLGWLGLLFTPGGMIIAQATLATPIISALAHRAMQGPWREYGDALRVDGASRPRVIRMLLVIARPPVLTAVLAGFWSHDLRGRRNPHRWRKYRRPHPNDDDDNRAGDQQRKFADGNWVGAHPDRSQHRGQRHRLRDWRKG